MSRFFELVPRMIQPKQQAVFRSKEKKANKGEASQGYEFVT
jgi:hypothetical protein